MAANESNIREKYGSLAANVGDPLRLRFDVVFMSERGRPFTTDMFDTLRRVLVTFAWIWREIFKLIRLPFPFF